MDGLEKAKNKSGKKNRCQECRKKVGLTGFPCRCGGLFCGLHRDPIYEKQNWLELFPDIFAV